MQHYRPPIRREEKRKEALFKLRPPKRKHEKKRAGIKDPAWEA